MSTANEIQWRNIEKVVRAAADLSFGGKDDPKYGHCWLAVVNSLTARDGIDITALGLEPLPALDTAQPVQVNAMLLEALEAAEKLEHAALVALSEATYELKVGNTYTTATDTYKANNELIHRLDKILNLQYRDRKRTALTAAKQAQPEPFTPDWSQDSAAAESIREHQAICNLLLKEMRYIAGISTGQVKRVAEQALEAVKQAQPERAPLTCTWTQEDDFDMPGVYHTSCGEMWSFTEGGIKENNTKFCPHCGGGIKQGGQHD